MKKVSTGCLESESSIYHHVGAKSSALLSLLGVDYWTFEKTSNEAVIVLDFAENYAFIVQDAAQGFHWNNSQVTIHPVVVYHRNRDTGNTEHLNLAMIPLLSMPFKKTL